MKPSYSGNPKEKKKELLTSIINPSLSTLEMQRQLGLKRYEQVPYMMHKLRVAMVKRDCRYELFGDLELDNAFVTVIRIDKVKNDPVKRGRGSKKKRSILVMLLKETINTKSGKEVELPKFVKLLATDNLDDSSVLYGVFESLDTVKTDIKFDAYPSFRKLKDLVRSHKPKVTPRNKGHMYLKYVDCVIGNL